jgi:hypothetical protein
MQAAADQDKLISEKTFLLMVRFLPLQHCSGRAYILLRCQVMRCHSWWLCRHIFLSLIYRWYRNFNIFRTVQLTLISLPCLLHLALSDFKFLPAR